MSFSKQDLLEFEAEAFELLEVAEKSLLNLDQGGEFRPAFDSVFRSFHNLKGASGMMELLTLQAHTHELENILMEFKEATSIPHDYISLFLKGVDAARSILKGAEVTFDFGIASYSNMSSGNAAPSLQSSLDRTPLPKISVVAAEDTELIPDSAVGEFIAECEEIVNRVADSLQIIEAKTHKKENLEALYRDIHSLKGSSYLFSYNTLGDIAHAMESSLEGVRDEVTIPSPALLDALFQCLNFIEAEVHGLKSETKVESVELKMPALIKNLNDAAANLAMEIPAPIVNQTAEFNSKKPETLEIQKNESVMKPIDVIPVTESSHPPKEAEGNSSIRVSVSLLDNLMTLMGEMVLVRNQVLQFSSKSEDLEFLNLSKRLNVVTSEIQGEMMKTRMQPIGNILSKFNRVVRDLSHELKKEINLNLFGAETELDKSLLESIKDPLTHIVRNSCDHGIETPADRAKSGKSGTGTINIRSYHEGGQVVIEVSDDGKGLNREVLLKKGIEKGVVTQLQASNMTEKEIYNLIFAPGFSTAASITNVSGRGVGMDVVRTNVERIGGSVELNSVLGKGTTIKIKIPLTLAIVPALIIKCAGETFAIPQVKLEELVRVDQSSSESKIEYLHGTPVYRLRGNILPLVNLNEILNLPEKSIDLNTVCNIAVLNADQCSFGMIVDEVQDTADIVVKPINRLLKSLHVYSGATILGDGSIALILDVLGISKVAQIGTENINAEEVRMRTAEDKRAENQEFLIVRLNSPTKHAIVLNYVHRLEEFKTKDIEYSGSQKVIRYGESILPIMSVSEHLGFGPTTHINSREVFPVVVIQKAGMLYGLEVEEIVDTLSTDVEPDTTLVKQAGIYGNINTSDELIVAIDPFELIGAAYPSSLVKPAGHQSVESLTDLPSSQVFRILNVLLVEDTVFFRKAVANVLKKAGHDVAFAVDGKDALEILEKNPNKFDLVVSDIEMPRMNGFELAKAVRANQKIAGIPMLAVSSRADKTHIDKGLNAGFNIYLEKLKPNLLLNAVSSLTTAQRKSA